MRFENRQCRGQPNLQRKLVPEFGDYTCISVISSVLQP